MSYKMYSSTTNNVHIRYEFTCENCGSPQSKKKVVGGGQGSSMNALTAQKKAYKNIRKKLSKLGNAAERGDYSFLGADPCSECGYIQSWQVSAQKSSAQALVFSMFLLLAVDGFCVYELLFSTPNWAAWLVGALFLVGTVFLARFAIQYSRRLGKIPRVDRVNQPELQWPMI
jgi:hypothetical protein